MINFKTIIFLTLFLSPLRVFTQEVQRELVDLNSLTASEAEYFNGSYKDFSATKGPLKYRGLFKDQYLSNSTLGPLDLTLAGFESVKRFFDVDFTGSYNPPKNLFNNKIVLGVTLANFDLAIIGITPKMLLNSFTRNWEKIKISHGNTLSKDLYIPKFQELNWVFKDPILYRGKYLNGSQFGKLQKLFERLVTKLEDEKLLSWAIEKLLKIKNLDSLLKLSDEEIKELPMSSFLKNKDYLEIIPARCREVFFKGGDKFFDESWLAIGEQIKLPIYSFNENEHTHALFTRLYKLCSKYESLLQKKIGQKQLNKIKNQLNRSHKDYNSDSLLHDPHNWDDHYFRRFHEMTVDRLKPKQALGTYIDLLKENKKLGPVSVNFLNESGIDQGGLRRDFFDMMEKIVHVLLKKGMKENRDENFFYRLGEMTARTIVVEQDIPSFKINAPPEFYRMITHETDLLAWIVQRIYGHDEEELAKAKRVVEILQNPVEDFRVLMGHEGGAKTYLGQLTNLIKWPYDYMIGKKAQQNEETIHTLLDLCSNLSEDSMGLNAYYFRNGFHSVLPEGRLERFALNTPDMLKSLVEGPSIISSDEFLNHVEIISEEENFSEAYRKALEGLIDHFQRQDATGEKAQEFIREFLRFATGSSSMGPQKIIMNINSKPDLWPAAHTCSSELDCPEIDNVNLIKIRILKSLKWTDNGFGFL